ncbi:MAG: PAS domain-containing sensor histidine kinase [Planctomycetota bacterium]|nr:PAS domain-containing sensor histidine kinase [Planctomycetota bacterium]
MQRMPTSPGTIPEILRALDLDADQAQALHAQVARALENAARPTKRKAPGHGKIRALATQPPAARVDPPRLVPLVLAVRDALKRADHGGRSPRARAERLDRAADTAIRVLADAVRPGSAPSGRRRDAWTARDILKRVVSLTPDAVLTLCASGRVGMWTTAATRMTGRRRWEVQRSGLASLFRDPDVLERLLSELETRGRTGPLEVALVDAAGDDVPVRIFGARLKAESGKASGGDPERHVLLLHDMTEVQHIRHRLIETEKLSAMAKIAGSVAHEFRNPLNSLFLSTDLLEDELEGRAAVRDSIAPTLAAIREEIERLNQIITHYLSLSKIASSSPEVVDLGESVAGFAEETQPRLGDDGVTLRVRADDGPHLITADPNQVRRILVNLVENALDAVAPDDPGEEKRARRATITLMVRRMRRSIKLTVKDNGPGIPEDLRERVFEPFFTSKAGGSGLGLYLVREIVLASGGAMSLSSSEARGTSVSIRWPFADMEAEAAKTRDAAPTHNAGS